jgi:dipeptidyl aminopeptidase/acylaminoacyl peptidase
MDSSSDADADADPDPIAAADYHEIVQVSDPQLSPDGERVAFVRTVREDAESYEATVHVVPADGDGPARRFTAAEGVDSEPRWSPSGDRLAFVSTRGEGDDRPQLWMLPTTGGEARRVTDVPGGVSGLAWSPDGTRIAFVQSTTAEERETGVDLSVEKAEEAEVGTVTDEGVYERESPDPKVIDRLVYRAGTDYFDGTRSHVYLAHLAAETDGSGADEGVVGGTDVDGDAGEGTDGDENGAADADAPDDRSVDVVTRVTSGDYDHATPEWGDETTLYLSAKRTGEDPDDNAEIDLLAYDTVSGDVDRVGGTTGWGTALAGTADGRLAHLRTPADAPSMRQTEVDVLDVPTGEVRTLTTGVDRTIADAGIEWDPDGTAVHFLTPDGGRVVLRRAIDVVADGGDGEEGDDAPPVELLVDAGHATGFSVATAPDDEGTDEQGSGDGGSGREAADGDGTDDLVYATVASEWDHRGDVFVRRPGDPVEEPTRLTEVNADYLADRHVAEPEAVRFESDGHEIQGWLLHPPGFDADDADPGQYPIVLEIHGGPHAMWSTSDTMWHEFQTLAARGYVVFWSNPRGSTGYGESFATAIEGDWGAVTARDVLAGFETVCGRDYVDADDAHVTGGSFGGFMTGWLIGRDDRFRSAAPQRGVYDLPAFYGVTDAFKLVEWDFGTTPLEDPSFLREQSPIASADAVTTPTLVIHAARDFRVPVSDGEIFYRYLKKAGVDTRFVRYPREGHELSRSGEPGHVVDRLERIARWFDGYSEHHDAPRALDRGDDGLSTGEED